MILLLSDRLTPKRKLSAFWRTKDQPKSQMCWNLT